MYINEFYTIYSIYIYNIQYTYYILSIYIYITRLYIYIYIFVCVDEFDDDFTSFLGTGIMLGIRGKKKPGIPGLCVDSGGIDFDHVLTVLIWGLVKTYGARFG